MRVDWAVACRFVEVSDEGRFTIVGGGLDTLFTESFPADLTTMVLARMAGLASEAGTDHSIEVRVLGPELDVVSEPLQGPFQTVLSDDHYPGWDQAVLLPFEVRFPAETSGVYVIEISVDAQSYMLAIWVRALPPDVDTDGGPPEAGPETPTTPRWTNESPE